MTIKYAYTEDVMINLSVTMSDFRVAMDALAQVNDDHTRSYTIRRIVKEMEEAMRSAARNMKFEAESLCNEFKENDNA